MLRNIAYIIIYFLFILLNHNKYIKVNLLSQISYKNILNCKMKGTRQHPIEIVNSIVGQIKAREGCRILNSICSENVDLGRFVSINSARLSSRINGISVGSFSSIASGTVIQEDYHRYDKISSYFMNRNIFKGTINEDIMSKGKTVIEEDVWIGSNTVVLSGVKIGRGSIIGAGSVVTKDIPRYSIATGNPAKEMKKRFSDDVIDILEKSRWWEWDIREIEQKKYLFNLDLNLENNIEELRNNLMKV